MLKKYKKERRSGFLWRFLITKRTIFIGLVFLVLLVVISSCIANELNATRLYGTVSSTLENYPELPESYVMTYCSYHDVEGYCLFLRYGDMLLTARRDESGNAVYLLDGKSWFVDESGACTEADAVIDDDVASTIHDVISALLSADVRYTYHIIGRGVGIPIGLYILDDDYIEIDRTGDEDHLEVMTYRDTEDGRMVRWNIHESGSNFQFVLLASEYNALKDSGHLMGWGYLPEEILLILFRC